MRHLVERIGSSRRYLGVSSRVAGQGTRQPTLASRKDGRGRPAPEDGVLDAHSADSANGLGLDGHCCGRSDATALRRIR